MTRRIEYGDIQVSAVTQAFELFLKANYVIGDDVMKALDAAALKEASPLGKHVLETLIENNRAGAEESQCVCQDTGLSVVFLTIGRRCTGGRRLEEAVTPACAKPIPKAICAIRRGEPC